MWKLLKARQQLNDPMESRDPNRDPWNDSVISGQMVRIVFDISARIWAVFCIVYGNILIFSPRDQFGSAGFQIAELLPGKPELVGLVPIVFGGLWFMSSVVRWRLGLWLGPLVCCLFFMFFGVTLMWAAFSTTEINLIPSSMYYVIALIILVHSVIRSKRFMAGWL